MKKFTLMTCLLLPLGLLAQNFPKGVTRLTGSDVTVTSQDMNSGLKKSPFVVASGKLFFAASTAEAGEELWVSDGTVAGTKMIKDIFPGADGASPYFMVELGGKVYFQANDGSHGAELWVTDGTDAGTKMVKDIYVGNSASAPELLYPLGDNLLFQANSLASETNGQKWLYLYKPSDGSVTLVKEGLQARNSGDDNLSYIVINKKTTTAYFVGQVKGENDEVYATNGTTAGTFKIKDITPESLGSSGLQWLYSYNDSAIFWRQKTPRGYANAYGGDSTLYKTNLSEQIWVSDGTEAGTHMLKFIQKNVSSDNEGTGTQAAWPVTYKNKLYFRADDGSHGVELWVTDCSKDTSKTHLFKDIFTGSGPSWVQEYAEFKGKLFFSAGTDGSGYGWEPTYIDGTPGFVDKAVDLQPGNASSGPKGFSVLKVDGKDSLLFGNADLPSIGRELWAISKIAGEAVTIDMGSGNSDPYNMTSMNNAMYYTCSATGLKSLFKYQFSPAATVKIQNTILFDSSNYATPQPLIIYKQNIEKFDDPAFEVDADDTNFLISNTKTGSYESAVYLTTAATDTIWVKCLLTPSSDVNSLYEDYTLSMTYKDVDLSSVSNATAVIYTQIEPKFTDELLYLVECGKADPTKLEAGEKLGAYQSIADQAYGADPVTDKNWGYVCNGWGSGTLLNEDKWGAVREPVKIVGTDTTFYQFEVENGNYTVWVADRENWGGRTFQVGVNEVDFGTFALTATHNRELRGGVVNVKNGVIKVHINAISNDGPEISWIKIGRAKNVKVSSLANQNNINVYPNPSTGLVNIKLESANYNTYELFSLDGKLVDNKQITSNKIQLNIQNAGIYILRVKGDTDAVTRKIVIK